MAQPATWDIRIVGHGEEAPDQLLANPRNWRIHPKAQQDTMAAVLDRVGYVETVIVNQRSGFVVNGHMRIALALSHGQPTVPVTYVDLSDDEEALVLSTFDAIGSQAATDRAQLDALLAEVRTAPQPPTDPRLVQFLAGMGTAQWATREEEIPEPPAVPITKPGDLWLLGDHRLLCGDSTKPEDVARLMDGQRALLMATDPPYLVDYDGTNHPHSFNNRRADGADRANKHWDDYHEGDGPAFFVAFLTVARQEALAERPAIYQWHAAMRTEIVMQAWRQAGLLPHQVLTWVKARAILTHAHYMWQHEPCLYGWVEGRQPEMRPPANATSVWEVNQQGESDGIHPTQKPVELFARPLTAHTTVGDLCYEPFAGSGTCLVAAERTSRRCFAMELEPQYVDVTIARWEQLTGRQAVRAAS